MQLYPHRKSSKHLRLSTFDLYRDKFLPDKKERIYTFEDSQGFFYVDVREQVYRISGSKTAQYTLLHIYSPLKGGIDNHPILALNGGGHDPHYLIPFGMRFVAEGIPFCVIGWPGYEENDSEAIAQATFSSTMALFEEAVLRVTRMTRKKPVGYFWSMGGMVLAKISPDLLLGAIANAPSPPPNLWNHETFEALKKRYPAGAYMINFDKPVNFPGVKAYWDDAAALLDTNLPRVGEKGKGPFITRDEYGAMARPFPPRMLAVICDYHYIKNGKIIRWYEKDLRQAIDWDGHVLPPTYIITGLQDWRHGPESYGADHKLWNSMMFKNNDLTVEYWDRASHLIQIQPCMPKLVHSFVYWMKFHGWAQ